MPARALATLALIALAPLATQAQLPPKPKEPLPPPALKVGDAAPPLKGDGWYGTVKPPAFEKGKVYAVTFWDSSSGSATANLTRLSSLCGGIKGVTGVAVTRAPTDKSKTALEPSAAFLDKYHVPIKLAFVNDPKAAVWKAYQGEKNDANSFVFVVGKDGKIAYVATDPGAIENLTEVLPKVLDGKWNGKEDVNKIVELDAAYAAIGEAFRKPFKDAEKSGTPLSGTKARELSAKLSAEALKKLEAFAKDHPRRAERYSFQIERLTYALWAGQKDEAVKAAGVIADAAKPQQSILILTTAAELVCNQHYYGYGDEDGTCAEVLAKLVQAAHEVEGKSVFMQELMFDLCKYAGRVQGRATSTQAMKKHLERYPGQKDIKEDIIRRLEEDAAAWPLKLKKVREEQAKDKAKDKGK